MTFEIRVICDRDDTDRVRDALAAAFTTGPARQMPTRDGMRVRLYLTADHRTDSDASTGNTPPFGDVE